MNMLLTSMKPMTRRSLPTLGLMISIAVAGQAKAGIVYDAAGNFSATSNPNGVWRYGWSATLGGPFIRDTEHHNAFGIDGWNANQGGDGNPSVSHNGTSSAITSGAITWQPGQLGFHPGPNNQNAVVRFTVPGAGSYSLNTAFTGLSSNPCATTTDVHVLVNGASILSGLVNGYGPGSGPSFSTTVALSAGDRVDFSVGFGQNGNFNCDTTGLAARLTAVPEPGTLALLTAGAALGLRRRRQSLAAGNVREDQEIGCRKSVTGAAGGFRFPASLAISLLALLAMSAPASASPYRGASGLTNPDVLITFDEHVLYPYDPNPTPLIQPPVTTQYLDRGVLFVNMYYFNDFEHHPHMDDTKIGNFRRNRPPADTPFSYLFFTQPVRDALFNMDTGPTNGIYSGTSMVAYLGGVPVAGQSALFATDPSNIDNFYGFTNVMGGFDEIRFAVTSADNAGLIDNLQYKRVPEPGTLALLTAGAALGLLRRRRRRLPGASSPTCENA